MASAAFTQGFSYDANQLLFNLDVPARPKNMAFRMGKPEPVIIEKFGPNTVPSPSSPLRVGNKGMFYNLSAEHFRSRKKKKSMQFTAVSQDSLNMAVQLARRDIKKQKEEESIRKSLEKKKSKGKVMTYGRSRSPGSPISRSSRSKSSLSPSRTKIVQSRSYKDKLKKRSQRDNTKSVPIREQDRCRNVRSNSSQTRFRDITPPGAILRNNPNIINMPVTTDSPPTRDSTHTSIKVPLTGDDKILHEIKRLRDEMDKCMRQIKDIEEASRAAPRQDKSKYAEDIEEERKRKIRAEEQTARSSRNIYMLNQQVKDIQTEIDKMNTAGAQGIRYSRKSQILTKLAAAHRGAVRVLQNFVSHLPDYDLKQGVPRSYQELGMFLRQLSLCCAQLEVADQSDVPDNVKFLLKDMADLNEAIDKSITSPTRSPSRLCHEPHTAQQHRSRSPARAKESHRSRPPPNRQGEMNGRKKEVLFQQEREEITLSTAENSAFVVERFHDQDEFPTEREKALKAGIHALVEAASAPTTPRTPRFCSHGNAHNRKGRKKSPVPPLNLPVTPRTPKSPAVSSRARSKSPAVTLQQRNQKIKKGLLIPSNLQSQREKTNRQLMDLGEAHYAEPTYSSRSKEVLPNEFNTARPGSPVSPRRSGSPMNQRRHAQKSDVARQVWLDREYSRREVKELESEIQERQRIEDVSVRLGRSGEWVQRQEKRIRSKLEPLLSQAEVEINADLLADMIMKDMVTETADEMMVYQDNKAITHDAMAMQDAPSLETMLQKLKMMEDEQNEIRTRWATIVYEDHYQETARSGSHRPRSPQPIQLTMSHNKGPDPINDLVDQRFNTQSTSDGAIMFTKTRPQDRYKHENLELSRRNSDPGEYDEILGNILYKENMTPPIRVGLTEEIVDSIMENKEKFTAFLKKMNYQEVGRFNPWNIVNELADEILADCFQEVSKELWEINNEIVEHTYKQEFKNGGTPDSANNSTIN